MKYEIHIKILFGLFILFLIYRELYNEYKIGKSKHIAENNKHLKELTRKRKE